VFFFPIKVNVPLGRPPIANYVILGLMVLAALFLHVENSRGDFSPFVLQGWSPAGLLGHMWLHDGLMHLVGNMLFLWVFGNAVCSKLGAALYVPIYLGLGLMSAMVYLLCTDMPMVGASGAISGVVGMFLMLFPLARAQCIFSIILYNWRFNVPSWWIIILWFVFDLRGAASGGGHIAYWAHIGGTMTGFATAFILIRFQWIALAHDEQNLMNVLGFVKRAAPPLPVGGPRNVVEPFKSANFRQR
jgi:membrane associated rhomboid family serine protease